MKKATLLDWGKSMYGGYYANILVNGKIEGIGEDKLADLRKRLAEYGLKAEASRRWDNI